MKPALLALLAVLLCLGVFTGCQTTSVNPSRAPSVSRPPTSKPAISGKYNGSKTDLVKLLLTGDPKAAWLLGERAPNKVEKYKWWSLADVISLTNDQGPYLLQESNRLKATITSAADQRNYTIWQKKVMATYKIGKNLQVWLLELQQKNLLPR